MVRSSRYLIDLYDLQKYSDSMVRSSRYLIDLYDLQKYPDSMVRSSRYLIDLYDLQKISRFNGHVKPILDRFVRFTKNIQIHADYKNIQIQWSCQADTW